MSNNNIYNYIKCIKHGDSNHPPLGVGHDVIAVLDDKPVRKGAQALSIPVTGTLGMGFHAVQLVTITPEFGMITTQIQ